MPRPGGSGGHNRHTPSPLPLGMPRFGRGFGGAPPGFVGQVPVDGRLQALGEVGVGGAPAELAAQLRGVDGAAAVVAGAVGHPAEVVGPLAHGSEDRPQHVDVAALAVGADEV